LVASAVAFAAPLVFVAFAVALLRNPSAEATAEPKPPRLLLPFAVAEPKLFAVVVALPVPPAVPVEFEVALPPLLAVASLSATPPPVEAELAFAFERKPLASAVEFDVPPLSVAVELALPPPVG